MTSSDEWFQKALSRFTVEFAAGDAIRALADKGCTVEEIHERLSFPIAREKIGELVWAYYLDQGTICLQDPGQLEEKVVTSYEKVQDAYGKISFRQVRKSIRISGEYVPCDFGKRRYQNCESYDKWLEGLEAKDREYVNGLPWPLETVWHKKDARMARIMQSNNHA